MNIFKLFLLFMLVTNNSFSNEEFKIVKEIELKTLNVTNLNKMTIEFKSGKKKVAKNKAIKFNEIVDICDECIAEIEDTKGNLYYLSSYDLNKQINNQQALLLFNEKFSSLGDTLVIGEDELSKLEGNELLDIELGSITNVTYGLNSKNWDTKNKNKYFKPKTLVFPFDNNTTRWITDIEKIRILKRKAK